MYHDVGECRSTELYYNGNVNIAANGKPCRRWETYAHEYGFSLDAFPDASWDEASNNCRFARKLIFSFYNIIVSSASNHCWFNVSFDHISRFSWYNFKNH